MAGHFVDTGTHRGTAFGVPATGRAVRTQEFAFYRVETGMIVDQNLRRGHYELGTDTSPRLRQSNAFTELALVV